MVECPFNVPRFKIFLHLTFNIIGPNPSICVKTFSLVFKSTGPQRNVNGGFTVLCLLMMHIPYVFQLIPITFCSVWTVRTLKLWRLPTLNSHVIVKWSFMSISIPTTHTYEISTLFSWQHVLRHHKSRRLPLHGSDILETDHWWFTIAIYIVSIIRHSELLVLAKYTCNKNTWHHHLQFIKIKMLNTFIWNHLCSYVGFEVFTAVVLKSIFFWDMTPCSP
jgi:hypothetical protein